MKRRIGQTEVNENLSAIRLREPIEFHASQRDVHPDQAPENNCISAVPPICISSFGRTPVVMTAARAQMERRQRRLSGAY
jgi:hypothetical protein